MRRTFKQTINLNGCDTGGPKCIKLLDNVDGFVRKPLCFASIPAAYNTLFRILSFSEPGKSFRSIG